MYLEVICLFSGFAFVRGETLARGPYGPAFFFISGPDWVTAKKVTKLQLKYLHLKALLAIFDESQLGTVNVNVILKKRSYIHSTTAGCFASLAIAIANASN